MLDHLALSNDTALGEKAVLDSHCSLVPESVLLDRCPLGAANDIPRWAAHWVSMVEALYPQTGDAEWTCPCRPTIDAVLEGYYRKERPRAPAEHVGPECHEYSRHAQMWAALAGPLDRNLART